VRADRIMRFRELLDGLTSVTGLTNEEKDPEEFLQTLLIHVRLAASAAPVQSVFQFMVRFSKKQGDLPFEQWWEEELQCHKSQ